MSLAAAAHHHLPHSRSTSNLRSPRACPVKPVDASYFMVREKTYEVEYHPSPSYVTLPSFFPFALPFAPMHAHLAPPAQLTRPTPKQTPPPKPVPVNKFKPSSNDDLEQPTWTQTLRKSVSSLSLARPQAQTLAPQGPPVTAIRTADDIYHPSRKGKEPERWTSALRTSVSSLSLRSLRGQRLDAE